MSLFSKPDGFSGFGGLNVNAPNSSASDNTFTAANTMQSNSNTVANNNDTNRLNTNTAPTTVTRSSNETSSKSNPESLGKSINSSNRLLKDLLEAASNLPKSNNSDLGSINLTLNELQKKTQQLRKNPNVSGHAANYTKAHYLLASSGVSAEDIENELNSIDIPPTKHQHADSNYQQQNSHTQQQAQRHNHSHFTDVSKTTNASMELDDSLIRDSNISTSGIQALPNQTKFANLQNYSQCHQQYQQGNLDNYLSAKKDENILSAIEQSLVSAFKDFDQFINQNISIDWKARRDELRKTFGVTTKSVNTTETKRSKTSNSKDLVSWNKSLPGNYNILTPLKTTVLTSSSLRQLSREKFEDHAKIIYQLNEARLASKFFPICLSFEELNKSNMYLKSKQISDSWKILSFLTNEPYSKINQEQKFFDLYQNNNFAENYNEKHKSLHKSIIENSKKYLENQFFNYMDEIYTKDDKKSDEFTPPNNINKVSYFINKIIVKNNNDEFIDRTLNVNGVPIWALIFYLLRSGLYIEALELVNTNRDSFSKFDKNFPIYLTKYIENKGWGLPSDLQVKLTNEFNQQFQFISDDSTDFDPYKYSVYKAIGKCDLSKKSLPASINLSIEDWLWFHLSIINEFDIESSSSIIFENYSLENLQKQIISLGPKKFNSSSNNPLYLKILILVGLYELSIQYTYEYINECDAVHLAIGLSYYGLLKVSSFNNKDELMIVNSNDEYEINYSRLLGSYTRSFKISDPKVASQYLILISMSKGGKSKEENSKCHEALRELILVSREFNLLLGELNPTNGEKVPGILEKQRSLIKLDDLSQFHHQIIEVSSIRCEEEGRIFDALLLYQLCQEFDTVVSLINKLLSEILATTEIDKPLITNGNYANVNGDLKSTDTIDNNIILLSQHIMKMFNNNNIILDKISTVQKQTNDLLLPVISIRDMFFQKNWHQTLLEIKNLGLIPINETDELFEIRKSVELLSRNLDDNLIRVIPSLLIMVMTSASQLNYSILTKRYQTSNNERDELARLKKIAKNCMIYAGMVQYKMPRETYSLLINLESLI